MVDSINTTNAAPQYFRGAQQREGGTNPIIPAIAVGGLTAAGVKYMGPSKEASLTGLKNGDKFELAGDLTSQEKAYQKTIQDYLSKEPVKTTGGASTSEKEIDKIIKQIFGGKDEINSSRLAGGNIKGLEKIIAANEKELEKAQLGLESLNDAHSKASEQVAELEGMITDDAKKAIKTVDNVDGADVKAAQKELKSAEAAYTKSETAYKAAVAKGDKSKTAVKAAELLETSNKVDVLKLELATKKAKADYLAKQIAYDAGAATKTELEAAKNKVAASIKDELAGKSKLLKDTKELAKGFKADADDATKLIESKTVSLETKKAKVTLATAAKEKGEKMVSREAFKSELSGGISKSGTSEGAVKIPQAVEKAFEALKGKMPKVKPSWTKAGLWGLAAAAAVGIGAAMFGGSKEA